MLIPQGKLVFMSKTISICSRCVPLRTAIFAWVLLDLRDVASVVALLGLKIVLHQIIKLFQMLMRVQNS